MRSIRKKYRPASGLKQKEKGAATRKFALLLSLSLAFAVLMPVQAFAERDLTTVNREKAAAAEDVKEKEAAEASIEEQIRQIELRIEDTLSQIRGFETEIATFQSQINILERQIESLQREIDEQNELLNKRLRLMYETGDQSVIEVLLGSANIVDFLANLDMVKKIHKSDRELIEELDRKMADLDAKKAELVTVKNQLDAQKAEVEIQRRNLASQEKELEDAKAKAHIETQEAMENLASLEEESARITAQLIGGSGDFQMNGELGWPVNGRLSSGFGDRWGGFHGGIDIAVPTGTPVRAAADGVVMTSAYHYSYGNYVLIDHGRRNGNSIATLYAHNSSLAVSPGQSVLAGQVIAYAGSTGDSTGPHVHFEVRVNGQRVNPMNFL
ncbi:MAG: peptidoglycan DD-metalloendopeptidase family protein [Clostridiales Family XIII bacterium]|jgi:murein DD-endopeptidase MepM/ murein hydrolase activator NlpD|nr:peptidoglycan DD-metalloendopeptidase family protein [Clostridiales Family XIII bacterium]